MHLTAQELATTLAALRVFQHMQFSPTPPNVSDHFGDCDPLETHEINSLCERLNTAPSRGFYKVRPSDDALSFLAWGALEPLTTEDPYSDRAEPLHFIFAATEELAVSKLQEEMDRTYGKRQWHRQHSDTEPQNKAMLRKVLQHLEFITVQDDQGRLEQIERWHQDHEPLRRLAENVCA